ncbi:hypothetical protein LSAT2_021057 [Lamellibrachia satsuma]|nr:hypothetical protein LSAT2_021057 [Lamellibrachia satsuma]
MVKTRNITACLVFSTALICRVCLGRSVSPGHLANTTPADGSWPADASNFPDPQVDADRCRIDGSPGYICDPDRMLTSDQASYLDRRIDEIRSKTKCVCGRCSGKRGHYSIAIALVSSLTSPKRDPLLKMEEFTNGLRRGRWSYFGLCQDNVVIAISKGDRMVYTSTGKVARRKITNDCAHKVQDKVTGYLRDDRYFEGLKDMLDEYETALRYGLCGSGMSRGKIVGIVIGAVVVGAVVLGVLLCCIGFCVGWDCVVGTCLGVCIGCLLGCIQAVVNAIIATVCSALCEACDCGECEPLDCVGDTDGDGGYSGGDGGGGVGDGF